MGAGLDGGLGPCSLLVAGGEMTQALNHQFLKERQRAIRDGFPDSFALRIHRALSWLGRAEREAEDADVRFILYWVGFNAAYAGDLETDIASERKTFTDFFRTLVALDSDKRVYNAVWSRFPHEFRVLLANRYVFSPFWSHHNGAAGYDNWADRLALSQKAVAAALQQRDTVKILSLVFDRLYVLRNQLVHGGATWNGSVNRDQVRDGAAVLGVLLPTFMDIMMSYPDADWGVPQYPVVADS